MKKFKFSLDTVLDYKQQVLEVLRGEHAAALAAVQEQEAVLAALWDRYYAYDAEYTDRKREGITILEAMSYQTGLRTLEMDIQRETEQLAKLRKQEEQKRARVVEAKQESSSIEKLKEKKFDLYRKAEAKVEEQRIEEFVSAYGVGAS